MNTSTVAVRRSIVVDAPQADCFETFISMTSWWPLASHTIGAAPARANIVQPHVGGRWYDVDKNGDEHEIGRVLTYEPPERIVLTWEINSCLEKWAHDSSITSEVEVRFVPESATRTRIDLEHRGLEAFGEGAEEARKLYEGDGAWTFVLAEYVKAFALLR